MQAQSLSSEIPSEARDDEQNQKWAEAQYDLAYEYYFKGDWLSAEKHIRKAIEFNALEPRYRLLCAQVFCARGWLSMALSELNTLKGLDPNNPGAKSLAMLLKSKMEDRNSSSGNKAVKKPDNKKSDTNETGWKSVLTKATAWMH
jgi:hypothetical protein